MSGRQLQRTKIHPRTDDLQRRLAEQSGTGVGGLMGKSEMKRQENLKPSDSTEEVTTGPSQDIDQA
jgi:transcriptional accessory protein Tex/SPT6